jgi:hypothetical protein
MYFSVHFTNQLTDFWGILYMFIAMEAFPRFHGRERGDLTRSDSVGMVDIFLL